MPDRLEPAPLMICSIETVSQGEARSSSRPSKRSRQLLQARWRRERARRASRLTRLACAGFPASEARSLRSLCQRTVESESAAARPIRRRSSKTSNRGGAIPTNRPEYALGRAFIDDAFPPAPSQLTRLRSAIDRALFRNHRECDGDRRSASDWRRYTDRIAPASRNPSSIRKLRNDLTDFSTRRELTHVDSAA